ncbi:hypothetical protein HYH03_000377 [Edaphochlamys debaryana]|uniref:Uncharacterized protein n=1 Tax=Edaphochlamys debaryana TaxID=47281 RepID=A0A836C7C6_9CHLO|nr:hypothetical protein HYH03_000377 [Edaphochlamys debaryana]|eukprot:KAG2501879.1 hypothetical protein HYH03_000377 [Edaphochlamys debaryana]
MLGALLGKKKASRVAPLLVQSDAALEAGSGLERPGPVAEGSLAQPKLDTKSVAGRKSKASLPFQHSLVQPFAALNASTAGAKPSTASTASSRALHRQHGSLPTSRPQQLAPPPALRSLSLGPGSLAGDARASQALAKGAAVAEAGQAGGAASYSTSGGGSSLLIALQLFTEAASGTVTALSSTRQEHEELLQQQREQFQRLLQQRARAAAQRSAPLVPSTSGGPEAQATQPPAAGASLSAPAEATMHRHAPPTLQVPLPPVSPGHTAANSPGPTPPTPPRPRASPATLPPTPASPFLPAPPPFHAASIPADEPVTEWYAGVQFIYPVGCRVEKPEGASTRVVVVGRNVRVELDFRAGVGGGSASGGAGQGPQVVLISSNCVCTLRKVDGVTVVSVMQPLAGNKTPARRLVL